MTNRHTVAGVGLVAGVAIVGWWTVRPVAISEPTAAVTRGQFSDAVEVRGELKASRSVVLVAPADAGELRIVKIAPNGEPVKRGAVVVEFDASTVERTVQEKRSELKGLEADIARITAEARGKEEAALTADTAAGYDVQRAELDYSARELLPRVDAEQKRLKVLNAEQKRREAGATVESTRAGTHADLAAATQKRDKARRELERAERQSAALSLVAPSDGLVNLMPNPRSGGWDNLQVFKEGDRAWSGAPLDELPDPASLFVSARVDEIERGQLEIGQHVTVRVQAVPDRALRGHIESIGTLARADFTTWPPPRTFEVSVALDEAEPRLRPGMTAAIRVVVRTLDDVLLLPPGAVFDQDGEEVAWVAARRGPELRHLRVRARNADLVAVDAGVAAGDRVLLSNPVLARGRP
jgi:HlyD family secretion protein